MKIILSAFIVLLALTGCSKTWQGVKEDSSKAWKKTKEVSSDAYDSTKEAINEATKD